MTTRARQPGNSCYQCMRSADGAFSGLTEYMRRQLDAVKTKDGYARGQILFQAGNRPIGVHCIRSGLVKLFRIGPTGKQQILRLAVAGELIGYRPLLSDRPHDIYAQAVTDVEVCCIPAETLRSLLRGTPPMMRNMAKMLASEMSVVEDRIVQRSQQKAESRLIAFLLRCAKGMRAPDNGHVDIPLSRREIADFIGATPETVIRALGRLQRDRLIRVHGRHLEIPRPEKLAARLQATVP